MGSNRIGGLTNSTAPIGIASESVVELLESKPHDLVKSPTLINSYSTSAVHINIIMGSVEVKSSNSSVGLGFDCRVT